MRPLSFRRSCMRVGPPGGAHPRELSLHPTTYPPRPEHAFLRRARACNHPPLYPHLQFNYLAETSSPGVTSVPHPLPSSPCLLRRLPPSPLSPLSPCLRNGRCRLSLGRREGDGGGGQPGTGRQAHRRADPSRRRRRARCPTRPLPRPRPHSRSSFTRAPLPLPVALSRALGSLLSVASLLSFLQRTNSSFSCGRSLPSAFPTASASPAGAPAGAHAGAPAGAHRHRFSEEMVSGKGKWRERGNPGAEGEQRLWNRVIAVSQEITPRGRR